MGSRVESRAPRTAKGVERERDEQPLAVGCFHAEARPLGVVLGAPAGRGAGTSDGRVVGLTHLNAAELGKCARSHRLRAARRRVRNQQVIEVQPKVLGALLVGDLERRRQLAEGAGDKVRRLAEEQLARCDRPLGNQRVAKHRHVAQLKRVIGHLDDAVEADREAVGGEDGHGGGLNECSEVLYRRMSVRSVWRSELVTEEEAEP